MQATTTVLALLCALVASGALTRMLTFALPLPLVQIALGAGLAWALDFTVPLEPELFLLLFLAPLLFLDAWRLPKDELLRHAKVIIGLAFGLVIFTVIGLGLFIHWLIPAIPQPVAFALAAVLAPTDPVAVSSITARVPMPKRLMRILEGESLLNDASGLVCLRFAIAAAITGTFSLFDATGAFLWLVCGGLASGVLLAWLVTHALRIFAAHFGIDGGSTILVSLLVPFGAYLLGEQIQASGVLAAVGAGVTLSLTEDPLSSPASMRIRRDVIWDMIRFAANGAVFIILGEQLPGILAGAATTVQEAGDQHPLWLAAYTGAIYLFLITARFIWTWLWLSVSILKGSIRRPDWRLIMATSVAGVKGTVTLAGILTLPLLLSDHSPFPARELAIFLAAGVIVLSLVVATFALPGLLNGLEIPPDNLADAEYEHARTAISLAAIHEVEATAHRMAEGREDADLYSRAAAQIIEHYRENTSPTETTPESTENLRRTRQISLDLARHALNAERKTILHLRRQHAISQETMHSLLRQIDLAETHLERRHR